MTPEAIEVFLCREFPHSTPVQVLEANGTRAKVCIAHAPLHLRPGATISGPTLMSLADTAVYALVLSAVADAAQAVTSSLTMHFLERPPAVALTAEAKLLRRGRRQLVATVEVFAGEASTPCAHAVVAYLVPSS
jgi:acyl-coenzyme A thioesterase PaaI-like protein